MSSGLKKARKIGLLGGSFNPAHAGHVHISLLALKHLGLDEVWWLVSPQNPLKGESDMAPLGDRLRSAVVVAGAYPDIHPTTLESHLGTRYTVDTIAALGKEFPANRFVWLMGGDNLIQMPRWKHWQRLFSAVPIAVFPRPAYVAKAQHSLAARRFANSRVPMRKARKLVDMHPPAWVMLEIPMHAESATRIRAEKARQQRG